MGQAPIRIGDVEVAIACEGFASLPLEDELPGERVDWDAERAAHPWAFLDAQSWAWHVHAFALATEAGVVMVDTGLGSFPPYRPWSEHTPPDAALADAGIDARDVRAVVLTHLHADHAGGTVLDGHPRFPNAVHHVHPADWSFFGERGRIEGYTARGPMVELERLGMLDLTEEDHEIVRGLRVVHAPGSPCGDPRPCRRRPRPRRGPAARARSSGAPGEALVARRGSRRGLSFEGSDPLGSGRQGLAGRGLPLRAPVREGRGPWMGGRSLSATAAGDASLTAGPAALPIR